VTTDPVDRLAAALADVIAAAVAEALSSQVPTTSDSTSLLDVAAAARQLSLGTTTVKKMVAAGQLRSVTVGRRRLIPAAALDEYTARLEAAS
jgi:excisionase family DNA binding protein